MPVYYPIFLDLRNRNCVVIGGGNIGEEKVKTLLKFGASVVVISPSINPGLVKEMNTKQLTWVKRNYKYGDLEGVFIAIVADTSDENINLAVSKEAKARNVPLNVSDIPRLCTWIAPAVARRGEVIIAASTGGASPALARKLRAELEGTSKINSGLEIMEWADLAPLLSEVRKELSDQGLRINTDHWQACLTKNLVEFIQSGRTEEAKTLLLYRLKIAVSCGCESGMCKLWEGATHEINWPKPE